MDKYRTAIEKFKSYCETQPADPLVEIINEIPYFAIRWPDLNGAIAELFDVLDSPNVPFVPYMLSDRDHPPAEEPGER